MGNRMRFREVSKSILILSVVLFCSCAHYKCDPAYVGPKTRSAEMLEYYSYTKQTIEPKVETIREKKRYVIERIEFPSALNVFGTDNIKVDYYVQRKKGKFPTVLALPIAGGVDFCIKGFAKHFASNGFNCAVVHNREVDLDNVESAEEVESYLRQVVIDSRQVLDYLVEREEVDTDRLGCLGLSLGGIKAIVVSGADERLKCTVIALAGGSMADIALLSKEKGVRDYIKELLEVGISPEAIRIELSDKVATDPLKLAEYADARDVLMYIAAFDRVIPRECGDKLWKAIGKPEVIYLFSGHFTSLLYLPYAERRSLDYFKAKFQGK
jgi:dienelactone hydrolase